MPAGPTEVGVLLANHVAEDFKVTGCRFALRASHLIVTLHALRLRHLQRTGGVAEPHSHVALGFSRGPLQDMPPMVRWMLRLDDRLTPAEKRQCQRWAGGLVAVLYLLSGFRQVHLGQVGAVKVFLGVLPNHLAIVLEVSDALAVAVRSFFLSLSRLV